MIEQTCRTVYVVTTEGHVAPPNLRDGRGTELNDLDRAPHDLDPYLDWDAIDDRRLLLLPIP